MIKLRITDIEGCRQYFTGISKEGEPFTIRVNAYATVEVETASIHDSLPAEEPVEENQAEEVKPKKSRVKKEGEE